MNIIEYENYHEDIIHGSPDFPYNTYLCSIPLDFPSVPVHWHDEMEIIYIKKGRGIVHVELVEYQVSAGNFVLVIPGQLHSIEQYENEKMEYENILFHPDVLRGSRNDICNTEFVDALLQGRINVNTQFTDNLPDFELLISPIDSCDHICMYKPEGYELFIKSQLFMFIYLLTSLFRIEVDNTANRKSLDRIKSILKYVELNYSEHITIASMADFVGLSESHFMRYFKEVMGESFIDYLKDYRLRMSARLLRCSDDPVIVIAEAVGFDNLSYYNRSFKSRYGITPSKYRKM